MAIQFEEINGFILLVGGTLFGNKLSISCKQT